MDAVSYSHADKQKQRIEKIIAQPDSTSGLVSLPSTIASGETITIPSGRTVVHPNLTVSGTLDVQGTLFVPAGGSVTQSLVDATVVKQDGNVVANDSAVVHKTGDETIAGVKTFTSLPIINGKNIVSQDTTAYNVDTTSFIANTLPSGAIIENGSNANGRYVKFADGTLICTHSKSALTIDITTLNGSVYRDVGTSFTFPHAFIAVPIVSPADCFLSVQIPWLGILGVSTTSATAFMFYGEALSGVNGIKGYIAIGRWKV